MRPSRTSLGAATLSLALLCVSGARAREDGGSGSSRDGPRAESPALPADVTDAQIAAVRRGLQWLADRQTPEGRWESEAPLATTSLALLAFMAQGNTESRGVFHANVRSGVKFLLRHVTPPGASENDEQRGYIHLKDDPHSKMHAHGYATLTLAMAYGMGSAQRREEMRARLTDAVRIIERSQDDSGGWTYHPVANSGHEGSITVCMIQALRAARDAGIRVDRVVIDNAVRYLERSQDPETGGFCYNIDERGRDKQTYGLTAAALSTLFATGEYGRRNMVEKGVRYMQDHFSANLAGSTLWFYYANFYAAQTLWQVGGTTWGERYWREWWPPVRDLLVRSQRTDGSFALPFTLGSQDLGPAYRTAFACLILEVPFQLLPLYRR